MLAQLDPRMWLEVLFAVPSAIDLFERLLPRLRFELPEGPLEAYERQTALVERAMGLALPAEAEALRVRAGLNTERLAATETAADALAVWGAAHSQALGRQEVEDSRLFAGEEIELATGPGGTLVELEALLERTRKADETINPDYRSLTGEALQGLRARVIAAEMDEELDSLRAVVEGWLAPLDPGAAPAPPGAETLLPPGPTRPPRFDPLAFEAFDFPDAGNFGARPAIPGRLFERLAAGGGLGRAVADLERLRVAGDEAAAGLTAIETAAARAALGLDGLSAGQAVLGDALAEGFDRAGRSLSRVFVEGEAAAGDFAAVARGLLAGLSQDMLQLAVFNPLKNLLFDTGLPVLGGLLAGTTGAGGSRPSAAEAVVPVAGPPPARAGGAVSVTINTPDARSFLLPAAESQVSAQLARAVRRGQRSL